MTDLKPNAELAYRVLDHIDADPNSWKQDVWISKHGCGTVACFAGWACLLSGDQPAADPDSDDDETERVHIAWQSGYEEVPERASSLLGIPLADWRTSEGHVFDEDNSREDLSRLVAEVFGPRPDGGA
jgi:hypothetical protein